MMIWLIAAAAAANAPSATERGRPVPAVVEARATVRILSGVRIQLASPTNAEAPPAHDSKITADGKSEPARLIEFE